MSENTPPVHASLAHLAVDHIGIAVHDLEQASRAYTLIGLKQHGDDELVATQHVRVRAFQSGDSLIELLQPTSPESPIHKHLEKRGAGLHHLALHVNNLNQEITRLKNHNAQFINDTPQPGRAGTRVVFLHPRWTMGVLVELVEHP